MLLYISSSGYDALILSEKNNRLLIHTDTIPAPKGHDLNYFGKSDYYRERCILIYEAMKLAPVGHSDTEIKDFMKTLPAIDGNTAEFSKAIANFYKNTRSINQLIYIFLIITL